MLMQDAGWTWLEEDGTGSGTGQEAGVLTPSVTIMGVDVKPDVTDVSPGCVFR